jgi:peptidoglycan/xylan/chitin deacetylase (PgdA/CDA1 family)
MAIDLKTHTDKYVLHWLLGTIISLVIYYSGIYALYKFLFRNVFKIRRNIILTYHHVNNTTHRSLSVKTSSFEKQMQFISKNFKVVSLDEIVNIKNAHSNRNDYIAVTFDDGYADFYLHALPVLKKLNIPGCVFLIYGAIGTSDEYLSHGQLKDMLKDGITLGSHTINHNVLTDIELSLAVDEIYYSRKKLCRLLEQDILYFAYPKGKATDINADIVNAVKSAGYHAAFTTINGFVNYETPYSFHRIGIRQCPFPVFKVRISGIFESRFFVTLRNIMNLN